MPTETYTPPATQTSTPSVEYTVTVGASDTAGLISAVNSANGDAGTADTICLVSGSTYSVSSAVNGTNGLPAISSPITIVGNDATIQRNSGAPQFRLFSVETNGSLSLAHLTLSGADAGGNNGGRRF